jgi:hypothetical protein
MPLLYQDFQNNFDQYGFFVLFEVAELFNIVSLK